MLPEKPSKKWNSNAFLRLKNPQTLLQKLLLTTDENTLHNLKDILAFSISHYEEKCHSYDHSHIKQILKSQERSKI